jgi:DNA-binding FrmR family transcriptional regulator
LRRIEGQVRGIAGMIEDDRYCIDILDQVSAVEKALRAVSAELVRNHLRHCVRHAMEGHGGEGEAGIEKVIEELGDVLTR